MEYWFAVNPLYAERHARRNIFFPQIVKTFVGSSVHEKHGRQAVMALSDLRVFVAAVGEEAIHSLFDYLDLYGLSCFHLPTNLPARSKGATVFLNYF
jgi:hypothetical protein